MDINKRYEVEVRVYQLDESPYRNRLEEPEQREVYKSERGYVWPGGDGQEHLTVSSLVSSMGLEADEKIDEDIQDQCSEVGHEYEDGMCLHCSAIDDREPDEDADYDRMREQELLDEAR